MYTLRRNLKPLCKGLRLLRLLLLIVEVKDEQVSGNDGSRSSSSNEESVGTDDLDDGIQHFTFLSICRGVSL